ncbi:uncharacterized protein MONOS_8331 [Monocercomonoides exilis]|uniref:uncharacterized protein n=1 Tax=Monocercomonoides exilis TaxID=2049356 RepID=UPI00355A7419|nr:hypothetical protein MONOS_8331 [Monocercomonoides exilis]|eukprot:MONOS_8331.1-p1 / transcript=MONOS_8331.1 / gene=MONOS_8331 / organism=Monocercomonoides_exilis_PA203 / gene_product=unspecified product / transcript_product=unspecified product / location=Mono_scaffold00312:46149-47272(-) / protein_length=305 / sequence_SO=supercontig / SO=protein_coding / is_pseudo=false
MALFTPSTKWEVLSLNGKCPSFDPLSFQALIQKELRIFFEHNTKVFGIEHGPILCRSFLFYNQMKRRLLILLFPSKEFIFIHTTVRGPYKFLLLDLISLVVGVDVETTSDESTDLSYLVSRFITKKNMQLRPTGEPISPFSIPPSLLIPYQPGIPGGTLNEQRRREIADSSFGPISDRNQLRSGIITSDDIDPKKRNDVMKRHRILKKIELKFEAPKLMFTLTLKGNDILGDFHSMVSLGVSSPILPEFIHQMTKDAPLPHVVNGYGRVLSDKDSLKNKSKEIRERKVKPKIVSQLQAKDVTAT